MEVAQQTSRFIPVIEDIFTGKSHLSFSSLKSFEDSPRTFIEYKTGEKKTTEAMIYGSMIHCLVLTPELFDGKYFCIDDTSICQQIGGAKPRATTVYKTWYAEREAECGQRILVETKDYYSALLVARNVEKNKASRKLLDLCPVREKPIEWEYMNFKFKGFIDADGDKDIFDLKTCTDANPRKFQRDSLSELYHMQGAMYLMAEKLNSGKSKKFHHIAVDRKGGISVHHVDNKLIEVGLAEYKRLLIGFNQCILEEKWEENYDFWAERYDGIYTSEKPGWMY